MFRIAMLMTGWVTAMSASEAPELMSTMRGHRGEVLAVAFAHSGEMVASGSSDKTVRVWRIEPNGILFELNQGNEVRALDFSHDGRTLAVGGIGRSPTRLWDLGDRRVLRRFHDGTEVLALECGRTGTLRTVGFDDRLRIWDSSTGAVREIKLGGALAYHFSGDGEVVAAGPLITGGNAGITLWKTNGEKMKTIGGIGVLLAVSREGRLLAAKRWGRVRLRGNPTINIYNVNTEKIAVRFEGVGSTVASFSNDGRHLALAAGDTIEVWDLSRATRVATLESEGDVNCMAFSPDDRLLATGSADHAVRIWKPNLSAAHDAD